MFIRATIQKSKKTGQRYTTHRLVRSYRNQSGNVRQETLLNLGAHFNIPKEDWKVLAQRIKEIGRKQISFLELPKSLEQEAHRIAKLLAHKCSAIISEQPKPPKESKEYSGETAIEQHTNSTLKPDYQTIDLNSLDHDNVRKIGGEHVAYEIVKQLQLDNILHIAGFNKKQAMTAISSIIARLIHPGSELNTHGYLTEQSGLDELMGVNLSNLPLKNLYKISDQLMKKKSFIEEALYQREKDLFNLEEVVTLYDITNTYFEGSGSLNPKAAYGRSKEKRNDCPLVSLGIVLDSSGFIKKSETFPGNVSEPKTIQAMLSALGATKLATVVMDAGFATEENIEWLKSSGYQYIVVSRKRGHFVPDDKKSVIVKDDPNNIVTATLVKNEETDELELYCHSQAKEAKTRKMVSKATTRYELELIKLSEGLHKKGCIKKYERVIEKLGRLKEQYRRVGKLYETSVIGDKENKYAISVKWKRKPEIEDEKRDGIYCLRTNQKDLNENTFWKIYTLLTELESAFRSLKSELGMRPVYHQKEGRVDGHIFISVLAYHLLHTIRYQLKRSGIHEHWRTLREQLQTQCRISTKIHLKDGRVANIRKSTTPNYNQKRIYNALAIDHFPGNTEKTFT